MNKPVRCKGCGAFIIMEDSGWLIPHQEKLDPKGEICPNREPPESSIDEYPVGYDLGPVGVERRIVGVEEMSFLPKAERHDCQVCGTWVCDQCGWSRTHAALLRPEKQYCAHCQSKDGHYVHVQHAHRRIQREHDEDADRLLGEKP